MRQHGQSNARSSAEYQQAHTHTHTHTHTEPHTQVMHFWAVRDPQEGDRARQRTVMGSSSTRVPLTDNNASPGRRSRCSPFSDTAASVLLGGAVMTAPVPMDLRTATQMEGEGVTPIPFATPRSHPDRKCNPKGWPTMTTSKVWWSGGGSGDGDVPAGGCLVASPRRGVSSVDARGCTVVPASSLSDKTAGSPDSTLCVCACIPQ